MSQTVAAVAYATWSAPETPLVVECAVPVLDELRTAALDGLQALLRGGLEVGGVLFGSVAQNQIRISAWIGIPCQHALGPSFSLSEKDRADLARLLENARGDPNLRGLQPVGWFVSHTRSGVCLSPSDLEIYSTFFPARWQVTLVLRPDKLGSCHAGFFVREADGSVRQDSSYREFSLEPASSPVQQEVPESRSVESPPPVSAVPAAEAVPLTPPQPTLRALPPPPPAPRPPSRQTQGTYRPKWMWALVISIALIAGALLYFGYLGKFWEQDRSFSLHVADRNGQLRFEWDKESPAIHAARGSSIEVTDNGSTQRFPLTSNQLQQGSFDYLRHSGNVSARMLVIREDGSATEQTATFQGPPVAPEQPSQEVLDLRAERDALKAEVQRLRDQTQKKKSRSRRR